jgi:uncharacterized membrane protein
MIFIFKIFPDWFWWLLLIAGLSGYFLSHLNLLKPYHLLLKIVGCTTVATSIFILGMLYCNNAWKSSAAELQAKVDIAEAQAKITNTEIREKLVVKTQVVKTRGADIVKYIDREVVKGNQNCVITTEFVQAHNRAAEPPR